MDIEEMGPCPEGCGGTLKFPVVENCTCHINPPCGNCSNNPLTCDNCGWECPPPTHNNDPYQSELWKEYLKKMTPPFTSELIDGKKLIDWNYDSRSGSTMVYRGRYEGSVTAEDIINYLGDGTFGHRGPVLWPDRDNRTGRSLQKGSFIYTKITD